MTFNDAAYAGFDSARRNWLLVVLQIGLALLNALLALVIVVLPIIVIAIAIGLDVAKVAEDLSQARDYDLASVLTGLAGIILALVALLSVYFLAAFIINCYIGAGTIGVLAHAAREANYRFKVREFLEEARARFTRVAGLELIMLLIWCSYALVFVLAFVLLLVVLPSGGDSAEGFLRIFIFIMLGGAALIALVLVISLRLQGLAHLALEPTAGGAEALGRAWRTLSESREGDNPLGFVSLMAGALLLVSGLVMGIGALVRMIPVAGLILGVPANIMATLLTTYLGNVVTAAVFSYHLKVMPRAPGPKQEDSKVYEDIPEEWDPTFETSRTPEDTSSDKAPMPSPPPVDEEPPHETPPQRPG